jgi:hypothetical protein
MGGEKSELTKLNWTIENVPCKTLVLPLKMHWIYDYRSMQEQSKY